MKWGTLYPADYVNVLFNACRAHIPAPFRFVCLTDDATGFLAGIEALPIPDIGLSAQDWFLPGIWPKLAIYGANLHGLRGRCLFIDLDMMVFAGLDDLFDWGQGFVATDMGPAWEQPPRDGPDKAVATSIFAFDFGAETQILDAFLADPAGAMARFQNEQDFVGAHARSLDFFPPGWVLSFKRHLRRPVGLDLVLPPRAPPASARVLAFHGRPRPADLIRPGTGFWDTLPHLGHGQVQWAVDYWTGHGGRLTPDALRSR
ncbi:hypothetical protein G5B31_13220 [Rhodobacter sp. SGA-6-6]|uniref:hypothetical protein n=1 Tax=Rhodobacter sp. SGA-6-6 TaxID=2710882 RepID=UPI0013ED7B60|nr:hypothetical protein [Rhodobacter sp. SGA-6-6]NGM46497.1 hypothetical protein [Rhodobacter sp. SGA-6-6]